MKKILASLLCVCAVAVAGVITLEAQATADYFAQVPFMQRILTGRNAVSTSAAAFVPFVSTTIPVPAGMSVLLSARFAAESSCSETPTTTTNWCTVRILIGGVEAEPVAGTDFAFDSTNSGNETGGAWESHSMDRHRCYANTTAATQNVPIAVQWGVTNFDAGVAPTFRIDDWSLVVQESQNCRVIPIPTPTASSDE